MLTREQRDKWAEELESGRWKQGIGSLHWAGKYCCLGVLWETVLAPGDSLTVAVGDAEYRRFVRLNDEECLSFPEIAKHVRALPVSDGINGPNHQP